MDIYHNLNNTYNKKIALLADIHYSSNYPKKRLNNILKSISINKPDYICIPGDIIDDAKMIVNDETKQDIINFIRSLSNYAPVILSYGNHDEVTIRFHKSKYKDTTQFFHNLNKLENVYFLDNQKKTFENINFIGKSFDFYHFLWYNITCMKQ